MKNTLKDYEHVFNINYYDVSHNTKLPIKMNMFFPTLIVFNTKHRYFNPMIKHEFLDDLKEGKIPIDKPYLPKHGTLEKTINLMPLTKDNIATACMCTGSKCSDYAFKKEFFLQSIDTDIYGYLNVDKDGSLLGGAEYIPSLIVPYDIPKSRDTAFITCVYTTNSYFDYKSGPLRALESYLKRSYKNMMVISDEKGTFPNGDLDFFLRNGYQDNGVISKEEGYCTLHLLTKTL